MYYSFFSILLIHVYYFLLNILHLSHTRLKHYSTPCFNMNMMESFFTHTHRTYHLTVLLFTFYVMYYLYMYVYYERLISTLFRPLPSPLFKC